MRRLLLLLLMSFLVSTASAQEPEQVENVTLALDGLEEDFIADSEPINSGESITSPDYPYVLTVSAGVTRGIVNYGEFASLSRESNNAQMIQGQEASFLVPFYLGEESVVDSRQELVESREFLNSVNPSFSFFLGEVPIVKLALDAGYDIDSFNGSIQSGATLKISSKMGSQGRHPVVNLEIVEE